MTQKLKQSEKIDKLQSLIPDDLLTNKSELLTDREALVIWLKDHCEIPFTLADIGVFLDVSRERVRQQYSHAKLILSRGYRTKHIPKQVLPRLSTRRGSFLDRCYIRQKSMRQEIVEVLEKDIEVYRAIIAAFN